MSPPFHFRLPESFVPGEFLRSPKLRFLFDDARYLISLILTKFARRDVDEDGHVRLRAKYLRSIMHNRLYAAVVDALLDGGAVTRTQYIVGEKAFGYALADRYRNDKHVRAAATCPRLIGRLKAFHEQAEAERRSRMFPVHLGLERQQRRLRIDGDLAREIISGLPAESNPFDAQGVQVADIENRDFHLTVGRYGRVSNTITSLKREVRKALRVQREPLHHADISCCQPALIGKMATEHAARRRTTDHGTGGTRGRNANTSIYDAQCLPPIGADLSRFCELVQTGQLYDYLLSRLQIGTCPNLTRDELKRRLLADVFAKRKANRRGAEYPSDVEDCFRREFPAVYGFIRAVNRDGWEHANLIRLLQREESKLVIETVCADLLIRHPRLFVLTLHDAIFTAERGIPLVEAGFERAFEATGFRMTLKKAA